MDKDKNIRPSVSGVVTEEGVLEGVGEESRLLPGLICIGGGVLPRDMDGFLWSGIRCSYSSFGKLNSVSELVSLSSSSYSYSWYEYKSVLIDSIRIFLM